MEKLFLQLVNCSAAATCVGLMVLLIRALLKNRAPRWAFVCLWGAVLLRLLLPVVPASPVSLFHLTPGVTVTQRAGQLVELRLVEEPAVPVSFPVLERPEVSPGTAQETEPRPPHIVWASLSPAYLLAWVWFCGLLLLLGYSALCYCYTLYRRKQAKPLGEWRRLPVFQSDFLPTPVVCGLLRPWVLLPQSFPLKDQKTLEYVLTHEAAHIRRGDHLFKAAATLVLYLHWFNPFVWWFYRCYVTDMEAACDERVVLHWGIESRADYASALLQMAVRPGNPFSGGALAFGESAIGERVKAIMKIHRRAVTATLLTTGTLLGLLVVFLTGPGPTVPQSGSVPSLPEGPAPLTAPSKQREESSSARPETALSSQPSSLPPLEGNGDWGFGVNLEQLAYGNFYPAEGALYRRLTAQQQRELAGLLTELKPSARRETPDGPGDQLELRFLDGEKWSYALYPQYFSVDGIYFHGEGYSALWEWKESLKNTPGEMGIRWLGYMNDYRILEVSRLCGDVESTLLSATRSAGEREQVLALAARLKELTVDPNSPVHHAQSREEVFSAGSLTAEEEAVLILRFDSGVFYTIGLHQGGKLSISSSDMGEALGYTLKDPRQISGLIAWMDSLES